MEHAGQRSEGKLEHAHSVSGRHSILPGLLAGLAVAVLSVYPQVQLWFSRGEVTSAVAYNQGLGDEVAYAAYINSIIHEKPRRNDPYTGRADTAQTPQPESLFSIQFLPAYAIAVTARVFGLSAGTAFIVLTPVVAFATSLILFLFLRSVTKNSSLSAAGVLLVLCCGALAAGEGALRNWIFGDAHFDYLPFLRRYQPAAAFPFLLLICLLTWRAFNSQKKVRLTAAAVGLIFSLLVYSYFYLWTAAAAWIAVVSLLWMLFRPADRRAVSNFLIVFVIVGSVALVPYLMLVLRGSVEISSVQALVASRTPDLTSLALLSGVLLVILLSVAALKENSRWQNPNMLLAASFALLPLILLNQQLITGYVMQPIHYKGFVTNYSILISLVLILGLPWMKRNGEQWRLSKRAIFWIALAALDWGLVETRHSAVRGFTANNLAADEAIVYRRLQEVKHEQNVDPGVVLFSDLRTADGAPAVASLPVMWAPHMVVYSGSSALESKQRLYRHLYYTGVTTKDLEDYLFGRKIYYGCAVGLFGFDRFIDGLNPNAKPITTQEKLDELSSYERFTASFDRERAANPRLKYLVVSTEETVDLSNLDQWYDRDEGEQIGKFVMYRLSLKQNVSPNLEAIARQGPPEKSQIIER